MLADLAEALAGGGGHAKLPGDTNFLWCVFAGKTSALFRFIMYQDGRKKPSSTINRSYKKLHRSYLHVSTIDVFWERLGKCEVLICFEAPVA